ncbi:MAG: hypothetical protein DRP09_11040 [Candidatus Thorarchaeota archaeon]|nr:MAG: hypothetical protein DRP09_11040 [Candidatus Thorarchaeota archaeon]
MNPLTILLVLTILTNFVLMTRGVLKADVGMTLTALASLILVGFVDPHESLTALQHGFAEFANIAVLFTAIAVPSHMLARSDALDKVGMWLGEKIGRAARGRSKLEKTLHTNIDHVFLVVAASMFMTWFFAGTLHNTTSILISAAIVTVLCKSYKVPPVPVLAGALVASNLGGFSTRWGDTPNIIEAQTWGLTHSQFFTQILWVNLGLVLILTTLITFIVKRTMGKRKDKALDRASIAYSMVEFRSRKRNTIIDKRLAGFGLLGLIIGVGGSLFFPSYELVLASLGIIVSVFGDYAEHRSKALFALGMETYATLISIFVLAQVMANSSIGVGTQLATLLEASNAAIPVIVLISYFGTLLTEAASWATAASPIVHNISQSTVSAWALGSGICAGSSSLITAATAGVILLNETKDNDPEDRITFGRFMPYGIGISAGIMLPYYIFVLSLGDYFGTWK